MKLAFVGKMGSGKTTCANYIKSKNSKFYITNFAKKLKEIAIEMYGMVEKDRNLLQTVGDAMRGVDPDVFANFVIKECFYRTYCMVDDARFPNELDKLKDSIVSLKLDSKNYSNIDPVTNKAISLAEHVFDAFNTPSSESEYTLSRLQLNSAN